MSIVNDGKNVVTCDGIILWDGITQPDTNDDGSVSHSIKIAIPETAPERAELDALCQRTLQASEFKGVMPQGGNYPVMGIDVSKLGDSAPLMAGRVAINAKTRLGAPGVYDTNGQVLTAMQYGQMIYPGAIVKLLVHCYAFNKKSKGLAFGVDGIQIVDSTTPKLDVGGGMSQSQVAAAFGGGGAATAQGAQNMPVGATTQTMPAPTGTVAPHETFVPPPPVATVARTLTDKANGATYEQLIAGGWTDETLIQHGLMLA